MRARERPAAKRERADGSSGARVRNANKADWRAAIESHLRHQRDTHTGSDKSKQTGELSTFENNLGGDARSIAGSQGVFPEAVSIAEEQERLLAYVTEGNGGASRENMFFGKSGEQWFREERQHVEFVSANGQGEYSYVDSAGSEAFEKNGGNFFNHRDGGFREASGERRKNRREKVGSDGGNGSYSDLARDGILAFDDIAASGFEFAKNCARTRKKRFADFGKADGTPETIEEASTELGFELKDLLGERGLRHVRVFGGAGEAAGFGDSAEVAKLMKFHEAILSFINDSRVPAAESETSERNRV